MPSSTPPLATAPLREARARIVDGLGDVAERVGALAGASREIQRATMRRIASDLAGSLGPHLEWEERTLHPIVDKYACDGPAAFSASQRYEHGIILRWTSELRRLADGDAAVFARRADNLLGLVLAHFELEEHVLFPVLDRNVSPAAFQARLADPGGAPE